MKLNMIAGLFGALLLFGSGCVKVGPDFIPPETSVPAKWLEAEAERARTDQPINELWWRTFDDPALDGVVQEAYRENLSLRAAGLRVLESRAQLGVAVGYLYPQTQQAGADIGYSKASEFSASAPQPGSGVHAPSGFWQSSVALSAAWEADFWGKYRRNIEAAEASLQASVADYDSALVSLTAQSASAYVTVRIYELRLGIARENAALQREALQIAQSRLQFGATSERDVFQAMTLLRNTEAGISSLETGLKQTKHSLSLLLGRPPSDLEEFLRPYRPIPVTPRQVVMGLPADLLRRRPDIRAAELAAAAQSARIGVAESLLYPSFSLSGSLGLLSTNVGAFGLGDMFSGNALTGSVGATGTWNLFNYGRLTNAVRVEDARFQQLLEAHKNTVLSALREAEDSLVAYQRAQDRVEALRDAADAAKRSADLAFVQYREGQTDFTTVLVAQQSLLGLQDNLALAEGDIDLNLIGLYRALGGGWELRQGEDFVPRRTKEEMAKRTNWGGLLDESPARIVEPEKRGASKYAPDW